MYRKVAYVPVRDNQWWYVYHSVDGVWTRLTQGRPYNRDFVDEVEARSPLTLDLREEHGQTIHVMRVDYSWQSGIYQWSENLGREDKPVLWYAVRATTAITKSGSVDQLYGIYVVYTQAHG
jgi:hypothetical protein